MTANVCYVFPVKIVSKIQRLPIIYQKITLEEIWQLISEKCVKINLQSFRRPLLSSNNHMLYRLSRLLITYKMPNIGCQYTTDTSQNSTGTNTGIPDWCWKHFARVYKNAHKRTWYWKFSQKPKTGRYPARTWNTDLFFLLF